MRAAPLFMRKFAVMICSAIRLRSNSLRLTEKTARGLAVLLFLLLTSSKGNATLHPFTLRCDSVGTFVLDSAMAGVTVDDTLQILGTSKSGTQVGIKLTDSLGVFSLSYKAPFVEQVDSPQLVIVHFTPHTQQGYTGSIEFAYGACRFILQLYGSGIRPTVNNTVFSLANASQEVIGFEYQNTDSATLRLSFRNDIADSIHIHSIAFSSDDTVFRVDSAGADFKVLRNGIFSVWVHSFLRAPGSKLSSLIIGMPNDPIIVEAFHVQSLRLANSDVAEKLVSSAHLSLSPNPSRGAVLLGFRDLAHARVVITNILGQIIREENVNGDWLWDGRTTEGSTVPAGTYYVIASGVSLNGKPIELMLPLSLMR